MTTDAGQAHETNRQRWLIGVLVFVFVGLIVGFALNARTSSSSTTNNSAANWTQAARDLATLQSQEQIAQQAGNAQHAAQLREQMISDCQFDRQGPIDGSQARAAVQSLCTALGTPLP